VNRVWLALGAYVALGVLSWRTIDEPRIRLATLAVLGMFAVKTLLHRRNAGVSTEGVGAGDVGAEREK
jgi:peptidoglycan/LPS O-acetylase OafA/YrhL